MNSCIKCGSPLSPTNKCYTCGNDDQNVKPSVYRRSRPLIVFMGLSIVTSIIFIVLSLVVIFSTANELIIFKILAGILLVSAIFDIVLAVFILKLKKWAFNVYVGVTVINCILRLISFDIFTVLIRGALTYLIFRHDYEHFE